MLSSRQFLHCLSMVAFGVACERSASSTKATGKVDDTASSDAGKNGADRTPSCDPPLAYSVSLSTGTCANLLGAHGAWRSSPQFPDAPAETRDTFCDFVWDGADTPTDADRALLVGLEATGATVSPACEQGVDVSVDDSFAAVQPGDVGGGVGCDVCKPNGFIHRGKLFAVLPPTAEQSSFRIAYARDANGEPAPVGFVTHGPNQPAVIVRLPSDLVYREGRVPVE